MQDAQCASTSGCGVVAVDSGVAVERGSGSGRTARTPSRLGPGRCRIATPHDSLAIDREIVKTEVRRQAKRLREGAGFKVTTSTLSLRHVAHNLEVQMLTALGQELCCAATAAQSLVQKMSARVHQGRPRPGPR